MKKLFILIALMISLSSCATVFYGKTVNRRDASGYKNCRTVRVGSIIFDLIMPPFPGGGNLLIDFGTGAIYKPCSK